METIPSRQALGGHIAGTPHTAVADDAAHAVRRVEATASPDHPALVA